MFLLKQEKVNTPLVYDQTHLEVKVNHGRSQLQEVRVVHSWSSQAVKWRLPKIRCQWFNKTEKSMELIAGVEEEYYQPSIVDVGTSIYIQIVPESKDLEYEGMPITRSVGPIQLAAETQEQAEELFHAGKSTFFIELKEIFLKQLSDQDQEPVEGKVPIKECLLKVANNKISLTGRTKSLEKSEVLLTSEIGRQYPQLQIDRSCGRFLNVLFNAEEYAIVILQNNKIRDVFYLLVKMLQENSNTQSGDSVEKVALEEAKPQITNNEHDSSQKNESARKSEESLPLSPQTIQKKPNDSADLIVISELRSKLCKTENEISRASKEIEAWKGKWQTAQSTSDSLSKEKDALSAKLLKIEEELRSEKESRLKQQQGICYLKNQCRILQQKCQGLTRQQARLRQAISKLQQNTRLTEQQRIKFGDYAGLKLQQSLQLILQRDHQLQQRRMKISYQQTQIQKYQEEIAIIRVQLQDKEAQNKYLSRKIESLSEVQSTAKDKSSKEEKEEKQEIQSLNFQVSKLKEEMVMQKKEYENLQKEKDYVKLQVRELIEENTGWRSKEKSSKHELKLQVVELKKLVNRFTEMITDKDLEINNLKVTNKTLNQALLEARK